MSVIKQASRVTPEQTNTPEEDKITLLSCPLGCMTCKRKVSEINKCYCDSNQYQFDNEYHMSIETLKSAFKKTLDLKEPACFGCTQLLRKVIIDSLQNIHSDLKELSSGFFTQKRYKTSFNLAKNTLTELKSHIAGNKAVNF